MDSNFWSKRQIAARRIDIRIPPFSTVVLSLLGFALMSYLTVRDFLPLWKEYRHNNQNTNVEVILLDPNFTVPQISLAIPHYKFYQPRTNTLFKRAHQIFPVESDCFYKMAVNLKTGIVESSSAILRDLLEEYKNESTDIFYNALSLRLVEMVLLNESKTFLSEVHRDFAPGCHSPLDSILPYPLFLASLNFFVHQCRSDYFFEPPKWGTEKLDALHSSLMKKSPGDKLESLFVMVLKSICHQTKFSEQEFESEFASGHDVNRTCENLLVDSKRSILFDYVGIWFTVESGDHSPKIEVFQFEFALHEQSIWASSAKDVVAAMGNWSRRFIAYADASVQYLSVLDQVYATYIYQTPPIQWGNETFGRKITIKYSVQNRARKRQDQQSECRRGLCFDESSVAECRLMCTKNKLINGPCGCVPFTFRRGLKYLNFSAPFCDAGTYAECGVRENWDVAMAECQKLCQDSCDYTSYSFQIDYEQFEVKNPHIGEFILKMIPVFNSFTQFTWSKKTSEEQFFAQLAGVANLYLGYSGLSVIAGLSCIIEWVIRRWRKRNGQEATDKEHPDIDRILKLMEKQKEWMETMKTEMERNWKRDLEHAIAKY